MAKREGPSVETTTGTGEKYALTLRMPNDVGRFTYEERERTGRSLTELVVGWINDIRTWFGLSPTIVGLLQKEAEALGMSQREYIKYLLAKRSREVAKHGPEFALDDFDVHLIKSSPVDVSTGV